MTTEEAQRLWHAVLWQAVRDAVNSGNGMSKNPDGEFGNLDWFDSRDCRTVCERAGIDWKSCRDAVHRHRERFAASKGRVEWSQLLEAAE